MCLSGFLWICTPDNIGSCTASIPCSIPYLNVVDTVIYGLLGVEAVQLLADARANLTFPEDTPSLLASKALVDDFGIFVYAEVLCCCGISRSCSRIALPPGSSLQGASRTAAEDLHRYEMAKSKTQRYLG